MSTLLWKAGAVQAKRKALQYGKTCCCAKPSGCNCPIDCNTCTHPKYVDFFGLPYPFDCGSSNEVILYPQNDPYGVQPCSFYGTYHGSPCGDCPPDAMGGIVIIASLECRNGMTDDDRWILRVGFCCDCIKDPDWNYHFGNSFHKTVPSADPLSGQSRCCPGTQDTVTDMVNDTPGGPVIQYSMRDVP